MKIYKILRNNRHTVKIAETKENFELLLEENAPGNYGEMINFLQKHSFDFEVIDFPQDKIIVINLNNGKLVVPEIESPEYVLNAEEWVTDMPERYLFDYVSPSNFSKDFWTHPINPLYHATNQNNVNYIMENGLKPKNESRGISNRGTGSAIFTSENEADTDSYGNAVFQINTVKMKNDGYMPNVSKEGPLEVEEARRTLAWKIGIKDYMTQDYSSEGLYDTTIIFYNSIPPQYLTLKARDSFRY